MNEQLESLQKELADAVRERDEARAEVEHWKGAAKEHAENQAEAVEQLNLLLEQLAEAEKDRDDAFRRGAEAMREACAQRCCGTTDWFAVELRALPIPEET